MSIIPNIILLSNIYSEKYIRRDECNDYLKITSNSKHLAYRTHLKVLRDFMVVSPNSNLVKNYIAWNLVFL